MMGLVKSASPKPTARSMARLGVRSAPSVMSLLRRLSIANDPQGLTPFVARFKMSELKPRSTKRREILLFVAGRPGGAGTKAKSSGHSGQNDRVVGVHHS